MVLKEFSLLLKAGAIFTVMNFKSKVLIKLRSVEWKHLKLGKHVVMRLIAERQENWRREESEGREETAVYFSDSYFACLSFYLWLYRKSIQEIQRASPKVFTLGHPSGDAYTTWSHRPLQAPHSDASALPSDHYRPCMRILIYRYLQTRYNDGSSSLVDIIKKQRKILAKEWENSKRAKETFFCREWSPVIFNQIRGR